MENASHFLYLAFATALFCLGISVFMSNYIDYKNLSEEAMKNHSKNEIISEAPYKKELYNTYEKAYLMGILSEPLEYDIQIDEVYINKHRSYSYFDIFHNNVLKYEDYRKEYIYDYEGKIKKIFFIGIANK